VPVKSEVDEKNGSQGEGDDADRGQDVTQVAPVGGHKIEHTARDEGKGDRIGACHPLAMDGDLPVTRRDEGRSSADHPRGCLHGGSGKTGPAGCQSDACEGTNKHGDDVDATEHAMELEVALADSRGEIDRTHQKSEDSGECMGRCQILMKTFRIRSICDKAAPRAIGKRGVLALPYPN
jgi:hypothetical protein